VKRGNFDGDQTATHCKVKELSAINDAKTAEPIEMHFGMLSRVDPRNQVLDGGDTFAALGEYG